MNILLLVVFFLHMVSHAFGRPDFTLDDPKTRFSRSTQDDGTIIFPATEHHHHHHLYKKPKIDPKSCENDICENIEDYPTEYIDKILSKSKEFQDYFALKSPVVPYESSTPLTYVPVKVAYAGAPSMHNAQDELFDVSDRIGGGEFEEQTLCSSAVRSQKPQGIKDFNGIFTVLVNTPLHEQLVLTETCESNNMKCKFSSIFPNNYKSACKQKYTSQRLMTFNSSGHYLEIFPVPTCCVCHVTKIKL